VYANDEYLRLKCLNFLVLEIYLQEPNQPSTGNASQVVT